jgi:hypothetical protein
MSAYALFLEPDIEQSPSWQRKSYSERWLEWLIKKGQGRPSLIHVEIIVFNEHHDHTRKHFATYIGSTAGFRNHDDYYTHETTGRWRAVPLSLNTDDLLKMCIEAAGSEYSIVRYLCTFTMFKWLGHILPNKLKSPGHCATLVARLVDSQSKLRQHTNTYGPVTLYRALAYKFVCDATEREPQTDIESRLYNSFIHYNVYDERIRQCEKELARHVLYSRM